MAHPKLQPTVVRELVRRYVDEQVTATDLAQDYDVGVSTVCRYLKQAGVPREPARRGRAMALRRRTTCRVCGEEKPTIQGICQVCRAAYNRRYHLEKHLGISEEIFDEAMERQGGVCAICKRPPLPDRRFAADHDHRCCPEDRRCCGKCFRGLLCGRCNMLLGAFGEDNFAAAVEYLSRSL